MTLLRVIVAPASAPNPLSASMRLCYRLARNTVITQRHLPVLIQPDASGHD
jgi:hypothetical protein